MKHKMLFRGKSKGTNEWVYGSYLFGSNYFNEHVAYIYPENVRIDSRGYTDDHSGYKVDPDTVGEYMGFKDVEGTMIFEGDILGGDEEIYSCSYVSATGTGNGYFNDLHWTNKDYRFVAEMIPSSLTLVSMYSKKFKIIGNIYDNPQLLVRKETLE